MKKRVVLTLVTALISVGAFAQNYRISTAEISLRDGNYETAKEDIDAAAENPKTSNSPWMWKVKGDVYYAISIDSLYTHLAPEAASISVKSYINCITVDKTEKKQKYTEDALKGLRQACISAYYRAYALYQQTDYVKALEYYELLISAYDTDTEGGVAKTLQQAKNDIVQYCANLAIKMNDKVQAKKFLNMMIDDPKYLSANAYLQMSSMMMEDGDTTGALAIVDKGRKKIPDNKDLFNQEIAIYSQLGKTNILVEKLSEVIEAEPNNILYRYYRGTIVSDMASKIMEGGPAFSDSASASRRKLRLSKTPADKKKYQTEMDAFIKTRDSIYTLAMAQFDLAEKDFNEALLIDPNYFDALFNLGVLHFNKNKVLVDKYNYLDLNAPGANEESKKLEDAMKAGYEKALEQLLKAYDVQSTDQGVLLALQQTYSQLGNKEKSEEFRKLRTGE